jgi:hypothetical protein
LNWVHGGIGAAVSVLVDLMQWDETLEGQISDWETGIAVLDHGVACVVSYILVVHILLAKEEVTGLHVEGRRS